MTKTSEIVQTGTDGGFATTIKVPPCGDGVHKIKADDRVNKSFKDISISSSLSIKLIQVYRLCRWGSRVLDYQAGFSL